MAARVAFAAMLVSALAVAVVAVGVQVVGASAFHRLMAEYGATAAVSHAMFDESITRVLLAASALAIAGSLVLAIVFGRVIERPMDELARAGRRIATGSYDTRVRRPGAPELASVGDSFNQMAASLEDQERQRRDLILNFAHELQTRLTNLHGYLRGFVRGRGPRSADPRFLQDEVARLRRLSDSLDALAAGVDPKQRRVGHRAPGEPAPRPQQPSLAERSMEAAVAGMILTAGAVTTAAAESGATKGTLFFNGGTIRTVFVPASLPNGGIDPFYKVSNGAAGQLGILSDSMNSRGTAAQTDGRRLRAAAWQRRRGAGSEGSGGWNRRTVIDVMVAAAPRADTGSVPGAGDNVVPDQIVDLQPSLYRFARSLTGDPEDASDLAQETTTRALGALHSFTPGTNLRAWIFRILRNAYLNQRRAARLHPDPAALSAADVELATGGLRPVEHDVLVRAELRAVLAAFRSLPKRYATPLYLTALEGRSYAEVAHELGIPIGTVMSRIYRARQMLLAALAEERP